MGKKKSLNSRRLTRKQVAELVGAGARLRADLTASLEETYVTGHVNRPRVYELDGDRFLYVFDENAVSLPGKGDIYPGEYFRRFVRWSQRVRTGLGAASSVAHWYHHSRVREELPRQVDRLASELALTMGASDSLDFSYSSLDPVSRHVEAIGADAAAEALYDHLVAYVGEVIRRRVRGSWAIDARSLEPHPFIEAPEHAMIMPINVVWEHLGGLDPVDLRKGAANEVRSARARAF